MDKDFILAPQRVKVIVTLDQTYTMFHSMSLLSHVSMYSGLNPWMEETARSLPEERMFRNQVISEGIYGGVKPQGEYKNFYAYLVELESKTPEAIFNDVNGKLCHWLELNKEEHQLEQLMQNRSQFIAHFEEVFRKSSEKYGDYELMDQPRFMNVFYDLLSDPAAMKDFAIEHIRWMWKNVLAEEWERVEPMLQESAEAFQLDYSGLSADEAIRNITGRNMRGIWGEHLDAAETMIFIPSPHMGPYLSIFPEDKVVRLIFGARLPEGVKHKQSALSRSELLVRLNALADDNRLRIMELIASEGELCAQDIITRLAFSQSAASRHLRQLSATGYLEERTKHGSKCYSLNMDRVGQTLNALRTFLAGS